MSLYGIAAAVVAIATGAAAVYMIYQSMYVPAIGLFLLSAITFVIAAALNR